MKRLILALALLLAPSVAFAQCNGVFPAGSVCGNNKGIAAPPTATTSLTLSAAINTSGAVTSSVATGPQFALAGATSNWISYTNTGLGVPAFTTPVWAQSYACIRRLIASHADYAIGVAVGNF